LQLGFETLWLAMGTFYKHEKDYYQRHFASLGEQIIDGFLLDFAGFVFLCARGLFVVLDF
jgi:hypothetical protein